MKTLTFLERSTLDASPYLMSLGFVKSDADGRGAAEIFSQSVNNEKPGAQTLWLSKSGSFENNLSSIPFGYCSSMLLHLSG